MNHTPYFRALVEVSAPDGLAPGESFRLHGYWDDGSIRAGYTPVLVLPHTEYGDYAGRLVQASNCDVLLDEVPGTVELFGSLGYRAVGWPAWCPVTPALNERLEALEKHPVLDEDHLSAREEESYQAAWEALLWRELQYALVDRLPELADELEEWDLPALTALADNHTETERVNEVGNSWRVKWPVDRMVQDVIRVASVTAAFRALGGGS